MRRVKREEKREKIEEKRAIVKSGPINFVSFCN
jgi:hypothetical protein